MMTDEELQVFTKRRAYKGFCPVKQTLLTEARKELFFKAEGYEARLEQCQIRLQGITFVPDYPGEDREID